MTIDKHCNARAKSSGHKCTCVRVTKSACTKLYKNFLHRFQCNSPI